MHCSTVLVAFLCFAWVVLCMARAMHGLHALATYMHYACSCLGGSLDSDSAHSAWVPCFNFGPLLQFWFRASVLVPCVRFCPRPQFWSMLQFWLMLQFQTSVLVHASVLAVVFCFGPLFSFGHFFAPAVRGGSRGAWRPRCGFGRRVWPGAFGSMMGAGLLSTPWGPCGVVGLLGSSFTPLVLLCCVGFCYKQLCRSCEFTTDSSTATEYALCMIHA